MKILFVTGVLRKGGAERVVSVLANEFVGFGHEVAIAAVEGGSPEYKLDVLVQQRAPVHNEQNINSMGLLLFFLMMFVLRASLIELFLGLDFFIMFTRAYSLIVLFRFAPK